MTKPNPEHQVTICHATASDSNPYTSNTVDVASIFQQGHDSHTPGGHVDVIPAFEYFDVDGVTVLSYPGRGDQSLLPSCEAPVTTTSTTTSTTTTTICADCTPDTQVDTPTTTTTTSTTTPGVPSNSVIDSSTTTTTVKGATTTVAGAVPVQTSSTVLVRPTAEPASLAYTGAADLGMVTLLGTVLLGVGVLFRRAGVRVRKV